MNEYLKVGAGCAEIRFPEEIFPIEGFKGIHDAPHVRLCVIDCGERIAIASVLVTLILSIVLTLVGVAGGINSFAVTLYQLDAPDRRDVTDPDQVLTYYPSKSRISRRRSGFPSPPLIS